MHPLPARHASDVHVISSGQLLVPAHVTSHAHDALHATPTHEFAPEQLTSHGPLPHSTAWHEPEPEHSTVHDAPASQSTPLRHDIAVSHWISQ